MNFVNGLHKWRYTILAIDALHLTSWAHGGHVGGTTQRNMLLIPLLDPAGVGG